MRILVCGAGGFIGAPVAEALRRAGHEIVAGVRVPRVDRPDADRQIACDFSRDTTPQSWVPRLHGIDAVINCVGVLRETAAGSFQAVHVDSPRALAEACSECGISRYVQISASGRATDGEFIASKQRGDRAVLEALPTAVVLRPGLVYSTTDAYGGTALLRALAVLPLCIPLPEGGSQRLQPLCVDDLAAAVLDGVANDRARGQILELAGPQQVSLRDYVLAWRQWLGAGDAVVLAVPRWAVALVAALGERLGSGPLGQTTTRMLSGGVVASADAVERMGTHLGLLPRPLAEALRGTARTADRLAARLYFVVPLLSAGLVAVWILSGVIGLLLPATQIAAQMAPLHWPPTLTLALARAGGAVDLLLGLALALRPRSAAVLIAMLAQALLYTLVLSAAAPLLWLDPWGGLLKNLLVIPALLVALAAAERR